MMSILPSQVRKVSWEDFAVAIARFKPSANQRDVELNANFEKQNF